MKAIHLKILGRVQGVFFRSETKRKADELGLTGWVRNASDESVEVFAQGKEEALHLFERWCRKGPPSAEVRAVERKEAALETIEEFEVRH